MRVLTFPHLPSASVQCLSSAEDVPGPFPVPRCTGEHSRRSRCHRGARHLMGRARNGRDAQTVEGGPCEGGGRRGGRRACQRGPSLKWDLRGGLAEKVTAEQRPKGSPQHATPTRPGWRASRGRDRPQHGNLPATFPARKHVLLNVYLTLHLLYLSKQCGNGGFVSHVGQRCICQTPSPAFPVEKPVAAPTRGPGPPPGRPVAPRTGCHGPPRHGLLAFIRHWECVVFNIFYSNSVKIVFY